MEPNDSGGQVLPIEVVAYHEAGHVVAAFLADIAISDIYLFDDNGMICYSDVGSIPDIQRVDIAAAGDAGATVRDGRGVGSPLITGKESDLDSSIEHIYRILQGQQVSVTNEDVPAYFMARRDAMMQTFSILKNRHALDTIAKQLLSAPKLSEQIQVKPGDLDWRHLFGSQARSTFDEVMKLYKG